jgi:hypothetical protein
VNRYGRKETTMHRSFWNLINVSAIIVGLVVIGGCTAPPSPTAIPVGGLEGTISDGSTGEPVPEAQVTVAGQAGVFTLVTGSDGAYEVAALPAGAYLVSVQATGYHANATQVGVVADVVSSGNVTLESAEAGVVVVSPTPAPAPTSTPAPTPTPQPQPTDTPAPTPSPSPTPTPAPTVVHRVDTRSRAAVTSAPPVLLEPRDDSRFHGPARITFRWEGPCCLADDEYYVVSIPHPLGVEEGWVKRTEWLAPDYLYLLVPESRQLTWSVSVRRHTGAYANGQWKGPIVSGISETWRFLWYTDGKGTHTSPLPTLVSPLPTPSP